MSVVYLIFFFTFFQYFVLQGTCKFNYVVPMLLVCTSGLLYLARNYPSADFPFGTNPYSLLGLD